jgi:tRNA G18 (ribose-2'-O)-methylase SpoU
MRRALITPELRRSKIARNEFLVRPRRPIRVARDGVTQSYNIGAIFRLCDAFLAQQLVICGTKVDLRKRRLVQAAQGTQHWVPWSERPYAGDAVAEAKALGTWIVVAEQTTASVRPEQLVPVYAASSASSFFCANAGNPNVKNETTIMGMKRCIGRSSGNDERLSL